MCNLNTFSAGFVLLSSVKSVVVFPIAVNVLLPEG